MACPYFIPTEVLAGEWFRHRARLPLGDGFRGYCAAGAERSVPDDFALIEYCNVGHACACPRLPQERAADAVRFALGRERGGRVPVQYVTLKAQLPADAGVLEYDLAAERWLAPHADERLQRQAEAFVRAKRAASY
jgi:hypothetical protein